MCFFFFFMDCGCLIYLKLSFVLFVRCKICDFLDNDFGYYEI